MGARARERVLDEHTYAHRARRVLDLLGLSSRGARRERPAGSSRSSPPTTRPAAIGDVVDAIKADEPARSTSS